MPKEKVVVALVRPSPLVKPSTKNFKSKDYEIFLTLTPTGKKQVLGLPTFEIDIEDKDKQDLRNDVMNYIYEITKETSQNKFGVKIKRIIFAKKHRIKCRGLMNDEEANLFVAATSVKHSPIINNNETNVAAGFYCFYDCIKESNDHSDKYQSSSKNLLEVYENWFKKIQSKPMNLQALFRPSALERIYENVTNPAYAGDTSSDWTLLENNINASQLMKKMEELNKANVIIYNPSYGIENPHSKPDILVINKYFMQKPDYSKIVVPDREEWFKGGGISEEVTELSWEDEFLLHRASADGDIPAMIEILKENPTQAEKWDNDGWAPVHYACWYGRTNALSMLLNGGCDPNLCNKNQTSLLHLAAGCGHPDVVEMLLRHSFIDHQAKDKSGRTALICCEEIRSRDWQRCSQLLKDAGQKNPLTILVKRLDGVETKVKLDHGSNTTMQDLINNMELTKEAEKYFTIWITSKNLHLQLKPDHKPLIELKKWPSHVWAGGDGIATEPRLILKRDVKLLPSLEENVIDPLSIRLLYNEAYHQVMRGLYPCTDEVAIALAAIVVCVTFGQTDIKKIKPNFLNDQKLQLILPQLKLRNKMVNWHQKVLAEYKELCNQSAADVTQLQLLYLRYCWTQIPVYGCAFFNGYTQENTPPGHSKNIFIGVNYRGIHLIKSQNMEHFLSLSYHSLTWELNNVKCRLHLKTMNEKLDIVLQSNQAALVSSLMTKLSISI